METTITNFISQPEIMPFLKVAPLVVFLIVVWTIIWKGIALWKSARLSHKGWFVALLIINTLGILEIIYIFLVARKYTVETEEKKEEIK